MMESRPIPKTSEIPRMTHTITIKKISSTQVLLKNPKCQIKYLKKSPGFKSHHLRNKSNSQSLMNLFKTIFFHTTPDAISATPFPFAAQDSSALFVRIMICAKFVSKSTATTIPCSKYVLLSKHRSALMSIFLSTDKDPVLRLNLLLRQSTCNNYRQRRDVIEF